MNQLSSYYLTGTLTGLDESEAKEIARTRAPAVARPRDREGWVVYYLDTKPVQHGQQPFHVLLRERAEIEAAPPRVKSASSTKG